MLLVVVFVLSESTQDHYQQLLQPEVSSTKINNVKTTSNPKLKSPLLKNLGIKLENEFTPSYLLQQRSNKEFSELNENAFLKKYNINVDKNTQQQYLQSLKEYDERQNFGLNSGYEGMSQAQSISQRYSSNILSSYIQSTKSQLINTSVNNITSNNETIRSINTQMQSIFPSQSSTSNPQNNSQNSSSNSSPVAKPTTQVPLLKMGTQANVLNRSGKAWMSSDIVNIQADVGLRNSEIYQVSASKAIILSDNIPKINSNVSYGGTSGTINAALNSKIIDNLQWNLQSSFPKNSPQDHSVSLNYSLGW